MKKQVFMYAFGLLVLAQACNPGKKAEDQTASDSIPKTDTVTVIVPAEIDTAAIVAFYAAKHNKAKGTPNTASKKVGTNKVSVDSDPIFESTDVIPAPTPAPAAEPEVIVVHDVQMYFFITDEPASFPGGEKALDKYLSENLQYPEKALEARQSRTVYPTVFLDEQGNPTDVTFRYEPTIYGFQDEARRILLSSPRWNPAKVGGKPVKSKFTLPISFRLE